MPQTTQERASRPAAVYRLYAADGTLLYIGSAYDPDRRCKSHHGKHWWPLVARRTVEWQGNRSRAYTAEAAAIKAERPVHNLMCKPGYQAPVTPAVLQRIADNRVRGKVSGEASRIERAVRGQALRDGLGWDEAYQRGRVAWLEHLDASGLFPEWVSRQQARWAPHGAAAE